jgi:hypothetical protein
MRIVAATLAWVFVNHLAAISDRCTSADSMLASQSRRSRSELAGHHRVCRPKNIDLNLVVCAGGANHVDMLRIADRGSQHLLVLCHDLIFGLESRLQPAFCSLKAGLQPQLLAVT